MSLLSVDEALALILADTSPLATEQVSLDQAGGRIIAESITARLMQPPFDCSAMDGYAISAPDRLSYPATFEIIGESVAGKQFDGQITKGQAVRIFTGAPLPLGADTVVMQEYTQRTGNQLSILHGIDKGRHIRRAGLDFSPDDEILPLGRELDGPALSLAAASGHNYLPVVRKPRVAILATGDELVPPGNIPGANQIVASNSVGISEIIRRAGGISHDLGIIADSLTETENVIGQAFNQNIDVLVTIGGASVGERDFVHKALESCGVSSGFWKIAMRPGKPLMYGRKQIEDRFVHVIGLPGNPVSSLVCSLVFLRPLIAAMSGRINETGIKTARLGSAMPANSSRRDFIRATIQRDEEGGWIATPYPLQDSSMLSAMVRSQALIIRNESAPEAQKGDTCRIMML